jgi:serine protease inhibitor
MVDYDKPTTIKRYMDFVRDQKASRNAVDSYMLDTDGKIKELDLIKK